jgi:hypothetical protein
MTLIMLNGSFSFAGVVAPCRFSIDNERIQVFVPMWRGLLPDDFNLNVFWLEFELYYSITY